MEIRLANINDYEAIWSIFEEVVKAGDTYTFSPLTPKEDLKKHWFADYMTTFVVENDNRVVGTYIIKPNQVGLGSHVANCSYMVSPNAQGKGVGSMMCKHSIDFAKEQKYFAIQFNIVVSTNEVAVNLWKKFGFEIIGVTPKGFRHLSLGLVDTYIMYKEL